MTHTPGPWRVSSQPHRITGGGDRRHTFVATLDNRETFSPREIAANARLIAAAPELLRILEQAVNRGYLWDHDAELWYEANTAVRAAKGE